MGLLHSTKFFKALPLVAALAAVAVHSTSFAGASIGFDPTGSGVFDTSVNSFAVQTDLWTNNTDSALAVGFDPSRTVNIADPSSYYQTALIAQARVGVLNLNADIVSPAGLNKLRYTPLLPAATAAAREAAAVAVNGPKFELTKVLSVNETVISQQGNNAQFGLASAQPDIDASTAGSQQLMIYFDDLSDGSVAVPGDGAGTVKCYGPVVAGSNACPANDGKLILSGHLVSSTSSFTASATAPFGVGTGSFDLRFIIDYVDTKYLDLTTNSVFGDKLTGTINVPSRFTPAKMWNGADTNTGLLLKVDSSEDFVGKTPEPGSLALVALSLLGMGAATRRRFSK